MVQKEMLIGVVLVVAALFAIYFLMNSSGAGSTYSVPLLLTDPPNVPAGTSALLVSYSSIKVHITGTNNSGWVNATGSGSVNLLAVVNSSKVIGYATVSANSSINLIRFDITSAKITVNGTTYNVTTPSSRITISVTGSSKLSANSGVLIDFTPRVNSNTIRGSVNFMLVPAAKAVIVSGLNASVNAGVGASIGINTSTKATLNSVANASITIG